MRSLIFWGPPGTGKTTLARIVATHTASEFISLSAVMAGVKDIKDAIQRAEALRRAHGRRTILFVDEIHRFNKSQQDALLPFVESGAVTLIGATTENPSFELNRALLSRAAVFVLEPLGEEEIVRVLERALRDPVRGVEAETAARVPPEWLVWIARHANGDARRALNSLEAIASTLKSSLGRDELANDPAAWVWRVLGEKKLRYDAHGEEHHDTTSAFIKSMRDSDPDAAVYYLARMLEAGEDPLFIARRMVIFASEDIGNADPRGLSLAIAVKEAVEFVGMPEARISLSHGACFLASAPKSNAAYVAVEDALEEVRKTGNLSIPLSVRNAPTALLKKMGYGRGYQYAHDHEDGVTGSTNLPDEIREREFYRPGKSGLEAQIGEKLDRLKAARRAKRRER